MDNKTVFVRTTKGEEQSQSRTSHLSGDVKRALLMVDGSATFGEISKRSAPSMRANLAEMFEEMQKSGLIQDKSFVGKIPKMAVPGGKNPPVDSDSGELDFMSGFSPPSPKVDSKAEQQRAVRIKEETALRAKKEAEATRLKAEQEAKRVREELEAVKRKAEQEARLRIEAAEREQKAAEAARIKAEQEAKRVREELEAAKRKAEQEARLRIEAAERERKAAEAARIKAEQEAARIKAEQEARRVREELEAAKRRAELEAKLRQEAEERARKEAEAARVKAEREARLRREAEERERKEAEAARVKAEQDAARLKAEQEAAQMKVELELVKRRTELETEARLEAEAKARALVEAEQADKERNEAESLAKQAQEAAQTIEPATGQNDQSDTSRSAEPDKFSFDEFQIDESGIEKSLQQAEPRKESVTEHRGKPGKAAPAGKKQDAFAFDSFNVDEPRNDERSAQKSSAEQQSAESAKLHETASATDAERKAKSEREERKAREEQKELEERKAQEERENQERIVAEQQIADQAKAKEQADAQSKVWAEAEQRALETAKANAERAVHPAEYSHEAVLDKPAYVARKPRKPFAWDKLVGFVVKLGIFLLVLLIGALFIVPYVLPMRDYMPKVQQLLSDRLHQPVHLGYLSGRILPSPRLDLGEIYIGDAKQFQAGTAQINFDFTGVFTDEKPIDSVDFNDVKVRGMALTNAVSWLQQLASDKQYPVSRMTLSQGTLDADAFQITGVEGELDFSPAGKLTQARLRANGGKYSLSIDVTRESKLQAAITVRNGALPLLPNWIFDELNAKGELSGDELQIDDFDAKILGGELHGDANINWRSGWRALGTLKAKSIPMQNINKLLDGNLAGSARFKMTSAELGSLTDSAVLDGDFTATDGVISGMDIVETARMHSKENMHGGRTHYDALSGAVSFADDSYHFKRVKVDAGVLNATANFDVTKQEMSGKMNVNLSLNNSVGNVDLKMGGQIDNPTLIYAP